MTKQLKKVVGQITTSIRRGGLMWLALLATSAAASAETGELAATPTSAPDVKLSVFDCGLITLEDVSMFGLTNDETPVRQLFVPCYLIQHPDGLMIWDTGLDLAMAGQGEVMAGAGITVEYSRSIVDQLADMEIAPSDIDYLALSHMHSDHAGGTNAFKDATLLVQRAEYEAAFGDPESLAFFEPSVYNQLADSKAMLLEGDHDVFGDGTVTILSMPGHSPGHQVLALNLAETGRIVLSGDLYHFRFSLENQRMPAFNFNVEQTLESMQRLNEYLEREQATLWIEHELEFARTLKLAPAAYR